MTQIKKINPNNRNVIPGIGTSNNIPVKSGDYNDLVDQVNTNTTAIADMADGNFKFDHIEELTSGHGVDIDGALIKDAAFDTNVAAAGLTMSGTTIAADGTNANIDITITTKGTGSIVVADGSSANPAICGTTNGGTGIHFDSSMLCIDTAGVERLVIDGQGDLNINDGRGIEGGTAGGHFATFMPIAAQQSLSGPGAVSIATYYTALTTTGTGDALTMAPGTVIGQLKKIKYVAEGAGADTAVLTPSVTTGFATCTFNAVGDYATFLYAGDGVSSFYWICIENSGCTLA